MQETPQKNRTIMAIIAVIAGLLMAFGIPFLIQTSLVGEAWFRADRVPWSDG